MAIFPLSVTTEHLKEERQVGYFQFEDISSQAQIEAKKQWATGTTYADINGDGYLDIYVCTAMYKGNRKIIYGPPIHRT